MTWDFTFPGRESDIAGSVPDSRCGRLSYHLHILRGQDGLRLQLPRPVLVCGYYRHDGLLSPPGC